MVIALPPGGGELIEGDRRHEDHPDDDLLNERRHVEQDQPVGQDPDQQRPGDGADDGADASEEARAPDDDGSDDSQLKA
jgi:hypothetical protein